MNPKLYNLLFPRQPTYLQILKVLWFIRRTTSRQSCPSVISLDQLQKINIFLTFLFSIKVIWVITFFTGLTFLLFRSRSEKIDSWTLKDHSHLQQKLVIPQLKKQPDTWNQERHKIWFKFTMSPHCSTLCRIQI